MTRVGATLRHPWRASNRYTTEAVTVLPSFSANAARKGDTTSMPPPLACSSQGPETLLPAPPSSTHCAGHPVPRFHSPADLFPTVESSPATEPPSPAPLRSMPPFPPASYSSPRVTTPLVPPSIPHACGLPTASSPVLLLSGQSAVASMPPLCHISAHLESELE